MQTDERSDTDLPEDVREAEVQARLDETIARQLADHPAVAPELAVVRSATLALAMTAQRLAGVLQTLQCGGMAVQDGALQGLMAWAQQQVHGAMGRMDLEAALNLYNTGSRVFTEGMREAIDRYQKNLVEQMRQGFQCPVVPAGLKSPSATLFCGSPEAVAAVLAYLRQWSREQDLPYTVFRNMECESGDTLTVERPPKWWHDAAKTEERFKEVFHSDTVEGAYLIICDVLKLVPAGDGRQRLALRALDRAVKRLAMPIVAFHVGEDRVSPRKGVNILHAEVRADLEDGHKRLFIDGSHIAEADSVFVAQEKID